MNSLSCHGRGAPVKRQNFISIARDFFGIIGDAFCAIDREWKFVYVSSRACEMWGSTPDTLIGRNFWDVFPQMTGTDAEKFLRSAVEANTGVEYETFSPILARWLCMRVCPISGALTGIYWHDISNRKGAEAALGDSEERFQRAFEQSPLGIATADPDGRVRQANTALSRMLGYSSEELTGLCYLDIVHKDDREECERQSRAAAAGEISHLQLEGRFVRKSGDPIWARLNIGPVRGHDGRVLHTWA